MRTFLSFTAARSWRRRSFSVREARHSAMSFLFGASIQGLMVCVAGLINFIVVERQCEVPAGRRHLDIYKQYSSPFYRR